MIAQLSGQIGLAYAFVEREIALSKRYWAWEIVWLVYGIVTSLSVAYIGLAAPAISGGQVDEAAVSRFVLYLLVGTIAWRFLGIVFDGMAVQQGARFGAPFDVDGTLELLRSALAPK